MHTMIPTKSLHKGGKIYFFLLDLVKGVGADMATHNYEKDINDIESYAGKFFPQHSFTFKPNEKKTVITANCSLK